MSDTTYIKLLLNRIALTDSYILMLLSRNKEEYMNHQNEIEERLKLIMENNEESSGSNE